MPQMTIILYCFSSSPFFEEIIVLSMIALNEDYRDIIVIELRVIRYCVY